MTRYLQQLTVPEIGIAGQQKLTDARVLIVGCGGLGVPLATYLVSSGVGHIGLVDGDKIAVSNLHRQFAFTPKDLDFQKVEILKKQLSAQNPDIEINTISKFLNDENATEIIASYSIICDCTDNVETRILLDAICNKLNKPLLYVAVRGWEGYLTILHHKKHISLNQVFATEALQSEAQNDCSTVGIVAPVCGVLGSLAATEVFKLILELPEVLDGKILCVDMLSGGIRVFDLR